MRKSPLIIAAVLLVLQLTRVANFTNVHMRAGWQGWAFSLALSAGVFVTAYFTRQSINRANGTIDPRDAAVRQWAWGALILLSVVDGYFNLADVLSTIDASSPLIVVSGCIYGAFPTLASAMLGTLQGRIDRLPVPPNAHRSHLSTTVSGWIARARKHLAERPHKLASGEHLCQECGQVYTGNKGSHKRWHCTARKTEKVRK